MCTASAIGKLLLIINIRTHKGLPGFGRRCLRKGLHLFCKSLHGRKTGKVSDDTVQQASALSGTPLTGRGSICALLKHITNHRQPFGQCLDGQLQSIGYPVERDLAPVYCCCLPQSAQYSVRSNDCLRAEWEYTEMKNTAHLSFVSALVLALSFAALSGLHAAPVQGGKNAERKDKTTERKGADANPDQRQMRDLDEQVQQTKSDVLSIAAELNQLEEKLLYPSGTQIAIFIALAKGDQMRLDAVRLQIDGQLVAHYIYSAKELEALRKGGVQRIYVGNVATGDHQIEVLVDGKLEGGADFSHTEHFTFRKEVKPKMVGLTMRSGNTPIALEEW